MQPKTGLRPVALAVMLVFYLVAMVSAEEQSGCVTCHLDEGMLTRNLSAVEVKTSALQSGAG